MPADDGVDHLDQRAVEELSRRTLSGLDKSLPEEAAGRQVADFLGGRPRLSAFSTPLLLLSGSVIDANIAQMAEWCVAHGVGLAPHGKTTMAPALWDRQL